MAIRGIEESDINSIVRDAIFKAAGLKDHVTNSELEKILTKAIHGSLLKLLEIMARNLKNS